MAIAHPARSQRLAAAYAGTTRPEGHMAHARLLRETLSGSEGFPYPVATAVGLLATSQYVNCAIVRVAGESELRNEAPRCAAEVVAVSERDGQLLLRPEEQTEDVGLAREVEVDFTEPSGTYRLSGTVSHVTHGITPCLSVVVEQAFQVQLRRFVRVPVHTIPIRLDAEEEPGGNWRPVRGEVIDLSVGGVGLQLAEPLQGRVTLRLEIELPGKQGLLTVQGWLVEPPGPAEARRATVASRDVPFRRGVAFDPLPASDLKRLQMALYYRQVELRKRA